MSRFFLLVVGVWMCTLGTGRAQESLSLSDALALALANNYQIRLAKAEADVSANNNDWSLTGRYPTVNLTLNSNNSYANTNNPASILITSNVVNTSAAPGVEANWILFDGYRASFTKQQLEKLADLGQGQLRQQIETSLQAVIQAYYAALVQREQLQVLQEVLALSRDRIEYQEVRRDFGQANTFDLLQAQDAYLSDSTNYLVQVTTYRNAIRNLNLLIGKPAETTYELSDPLTPPLEAYRLDELNERLLASNQVLRNLAMSRELASINTRLQETVLKPSLSLRTGASYNVGIGFGNQTFNFVSGQVTLDVPQIAAKNLNAFVNLSLVYTIFDAGARRRRIGSARLEEIRTQVSYDAQRETLSTQLANTLTTYNNQRDLVQLTQQLVDNARRNLSIADERLRGGLISSFDYRTVQLGYINATLSRLNAIQNLKNTETELIRLTGGLIR